MAGRSLDCSANFRYGHVNPHRRGLDGAGKRRVLVLAPQPFYEDRGTPMAIRELVGALTRLGYAVDLATFPVGRDVEIPGVRLIRTANPYRFRHVRIGLTWRKLLLDVMLFVTAFRLLRQNEYFSIHGVEEGGFLAALLGRVFRVPVVYEMQSSLPQQLAFRAVFRAKPMQAVLSACERWLLRHVDLVACSAGLADHVRGIVPGVPVQEWRYPIRQENVSPGDAGELRASLGIAAESWVVMYSGTFELYQGLADVIAAVPLAQPYIPRLILVMVGASADSAAEMHRQAERVGVADRIRILPRCPVEEIARYHAMADVLLAPRAAGSNLPLKVYHYMGANRPILATGASSEHAVLGCGRALLVEHGPAAIACGLVQMNDDPDLAAGLAREARGYADRMLGSMQFEEAVRSVCDRFQPAAGPATVTVVPA